MASIPRYLTLCHPDLTLCFAPNITLCHGTKFGTLRYTCTRGSGRPTSREGAALRVGRYKILTNTPWCPSVAPSEGALSGMSCGDAGESWLFDVEAEAHYRDNTCATFRFFSALARGVYSRSSIAIVDLEYDLRDAGPENVGLRDPMAC